MDEEQMYKLLDTADEQVLAMESRITRTIRLVDKMQRGLLDNTDPGGLVYGGDVYQMLEDIKTLLEED